MNVIIFIEDVGLGGVLRQVSLLAEGLRRKGHKVSLLGLAERDLEWHQVWDSTLELAVLYRKKARLGIIRAARFIETVALLRRILRRRKIDVVYAVQGDTVKLLAWLASRGSGARVIWGVRGSGLDRRFKSLGWKGFAAWKSCSWLSAFVPLIIMNSDAGQIHKNHFASQRCRSLVIHNGFDVHRFAPDPAARRRVRSEWNVGSEKVIGIAGRLSPFKGQEVFIRAAARLLRRQSDTRFVIIGSGRERERLENVSRDLGLWNRLIWAGGREDMPAVYNAMDVLCSASTAGEGCPNVIGEAMACGVPCVVTEVGDSAKIVGDLGLVVSPGDEVALAEALELMLKKLDAVDCRQLRRRIADNFGVEAMVEKTERALLEMTSIGSVH